MPRGHLPVLLDSLGPGSSPQFLQAQGFAFHTEFFVQACNGCRGAGAVVGSAFGRGTEERQGMHGGGQGRVGLSLSLIHI